MLQRDVGTCGDRLWMSPVCPASHHVPIGRWSRGHQAPSFPLGHSPFRTPHVPVPSCDIGRQEAQEQLLQGLGAKMLLGAPVPKIELDAPRWTGAKTGLDASLVAGRGCQISWLRVYHARNKVYIDYIIPKCWRPRNNTFWGLLKPMIWNNPAGQCWLTADQKTKPQS